MSRMPDRVRVRARYEMDNASMAAFLMSDRVDDLVQKVGNDIADAAKHLAIAEGLVDTTAYIENFETRKVIGGHDAEGGPRRAVEVYNEDEAAAPNEFGNGSILDNRILTRASEPYRSPMPPRMR